RDFPTWYAQLPCRRLFMPEVLIRSTIQHGKLLPRYPAHNSCRSRVWSTQQRCGAAISFSLTSNRFWRKRPGASVVGLRGRLWVGRADFVALAETSASPL